MRALVVLGVLFGLCGAVLAETWHLEEDAGWETVSRLRRAPAGYLLAVADYKKLVSRGDTKAAAEALARLKADFPAVLGRGFETFAEAEMLFAQGRFDKATRSYDKFLGAYPESELRASVLQRQFQIGTAYLSGQKRKVLKLFKMRAYEEGVKIMDRIADRAGDAPIAKRAMAASAKSYEKRGKFIAGYEKWSEISSLWPTGEMGREALAGMARCMHAAYKGPKYDASGLISARQYYGEFKLRYPKHARQINVDSTLARIEEQIAHKKYVIGRYYDKAGDKLAANLYYQQVLDNWPGSAAAEQVKELKSKR